jgi:hypothetical protein
VRLPRDITPGARARRALLADLLVALGLALVVLLLAAGIGIVAVLALPVLLIGLSWIAVEAALRGVARRRRKAARPQGERKVAKL